MTASNTSARDWSFHYTPWEAEFLSEVARASRLIRIACPFIKLRNARLLLESISQNTQGLRVQLLTRLNVRDCASFVHDLAALRLFLANPLHPSCDVEVRIDNSLHAKLYAFDERRIFVTSSNLTYAGFHKNEEVALGTCVSGMVEAAVSRFQFLFTNAAPLTEEAIDAVALRVRALPPTPLESLESATRAEPTPACIEPDTPEIVHSRNEDVVQKVDACLEAQINKEALADITPLSAGVSQADAVDRVSENRVVEDFAARFLGTFGFAPPPLDTIAAITVHKSAYDSLKNLKPNAIEAQYLEDVGRAAYELVVSLLVNEKAQPASVGEDISLKMRHVCGSGLLRRQLARRGLTQLVVGKGFYETLSQPTEAKVLQRTTDAVAERLLGYVFLSCEWHRFVAICRELLDLDEETSFATLRDWEYKSQLQKLSQQLLNDLPRYECVESEGPDHDKRFVVEVGLGGSRKQLWRGSGGSLKAAETEAAYEAICSLNHAFRDRKRRFSESGALVDSVAKLCAKEGLSTLRNLVGAEIEPAEAQAVLIPFGHGEPFVQCLRARLAQVGGCVRSVIALKRARQWCHTAHEMRMWLSNANSNKAVVEAIRGTPFEKWFIMLDKQPLFRDSTQPGPLVTSLNALLGAVVCTHGLDACDQIGVLLYSRGRSQEAFARQPARSQLQAKIQAVVKNDYNSVFLIQSRSTRPPEMAHDQEFETVLLLDGTEIGRARGKSKKEATEAASAMALLNPQVQVLLEQWERRIDTRDG